MKKISYKITFSLGSGYSGKGKKYGQKFAEQVIEKWMIERVKKNLPTVSGFLQFGRLLFPARGRRKDGKLVTISDTGRYSGELASVGDDKRGDKEVKETLVSLAERLKEKLGQDKVYIIYKEENWFV